MNIRLFVYLLVCLSAVFVGGVHHRWTKRDASETFKGMDYH